jgi:hypothetical protein
MLPPSLEPSAMWTRFGLSASPDFTLKTVRPLNLGANNLNQEHRALKKVFQFIDGSFSIIGFARI